MLGRQLLMPLLVNNGNDIEMVIWIYEGNISLVKTANENGQEGEINLFKNQWFVPSVFHKFTFFCQYKCLEILFMHKNVFIIYIFSYCFSSKRQELY